MSRRLRKRYLELGTSPPRSSKYKAKKKNIHSDCSSDSSTSDKEMFYNIIDKKTFVEGRAVDSDFEKSEPDDIAEACLGILDRNISSNDSHSHDENIAESLESYHNYHIYNTNEIDDTSSSNSSIPYNSDNSCYGNDSDVDNDFWMTESQHDVSELINKLKQNDFNKIINARFVVSEAEVLHGLNKVVSRHTLCVSVMEDICKMMNSFTDSPIISDSSYLLDKLLRSKDCVEYHAVCPKCEMYLKKFHPIERYIRCDECKINVSVNGNSVNFFVILNIQEKVKFLLQNNQEYYKTIINNERRQTEYSDISDGLKYKEFINSLPNDHKDSYVTSTFNTDGSPVFKSSNFSVWPIQIILNELPPNIRFKETIICALWFGKCKPNMNVFLKTFAQHINSLNVEGIQLKIGNDVKHIRLYPICCCVDSVARAPMQGLTQYNGYYGCNWCYHPGIAVKHKKNKILKYPVLKDAPEKRTHLQTLQHMRTKSKQVIEKKKERKSKSVMGIKNVSALIHLPFFDLVDGFVPDPMHCIFLGICKQFANYWFDEPANKLYSLKKNKEAIDELLLKMKVPQQLARLSRPIKDRKYWKSKEWENWLLYYSVPILAEIPNFKHYSNHWQLLVEATHILYSDTISKFDLQRANTYLKEFVGGTQKYYSKSAATFNVHQLLHLTESVTNWGPLWAHNGYTFESGNGKIVKMIKAAKGVLYQICRKIEYNHSSIILEKHLLENREDSPVLEFASYLDNRITKRTIETEENRYFGRAMYTPSNLIEKFQLPENIKSFYRMLRNNCIFSSCRKRTIRSSNSFAYTKQGDFIQIIEFLIDENGKKEYTLCNLIETKNAFINCKKIKKIIKIGIEAVLINTIDIDAIAVCIDSSSQYICEVPNLLQD